MRVTGVLTDFRVVAVPPDPAPSGVRIQGSDPALGEYTMPINFSNAEWTLDSQGGLAAGETYASLSCS